MELIGAPAPVGTAEALAVLCAALDAAGLQTYRVGMGDATLYPTLLSGLGVPEPDQRTAAGGLVKGDFVALERAVEALSVDDGARALLLRVPHVRGGPEVLDELDEALHEPVMGLRAVLEPAAGGGRRPGDVRLWPGASLGYYTGAVFQVYDPAYGVPLGSGGRYDELLGRFGRNAPRGRLRAQRRAAAHRAHRRGAGASV